ncbi:MAG TPA: mechanosensitive ion channel domain-containing protein [Spirochaetia bacterium]|nr:mechanosensitive ion channel domain-containing protein [Spirochaetia bacterium]
MISYLTGLIGNELAARAALAAAVGILIIVLVRIVQRLFTRRIQVNEARYRTRKFVNFFGYVAILFAVLALFSERLGGLTVALGLTGAGIALALQDVIASLAGFFAITFGGYFKPGDRVQFGGVRGDVIDIGLVRTTFMELGEWVDGDLFTGRVVRVSNGAVFRDPVFNYSGEFPFLWDEIRIPVKHGSDIDLAREILHREVEAEVGEFTRASSEAWRSLVTRYLIEKARLEPLVTMVADESWLAFTIRYIVDYRLRRTTRDRLFRRILAGFAASEGRVAIAAASSEVALSTEETLEVRLAQGRRGSE